MAGETHRDVSAGDRRLGDEWADWDGKVQDISSDTRGRVFVGVAMATIAAILGVTALFGWLIYPRLNQLGENVGPFFNYAYFAMAAILIGWLMLFILGAATKRPFLSTLMVIPRLVNLLLEMSIWIGRLFGISRDRLVNSFLKLHNLFLASDRTRVRADRLLLLLPRCLTRDMFRSLRELGQKYAIKVATAGGGGEARRKIKQHHPGLIIAVACERDLLLGFIDVNPHIPVIGFPNIRPCGPCKDTEVDLPQIEATIQRHILLSHN